MNIVKIGYGPYAFPVPLVIFMDLKTGKHHNFEWLMNEKEKNLAKDFWITGIWNKQPK